MSFFDVIFLAVGLAMDCFAVSLAKGMSAGRLNLRGALPMAVSFALFQAGMPLLGYAAGVFFSDFVGRVAPWIALALLGFIGGKMVKEHFSGEEPQGGDADYGFGTVIALSVATSIDALATGLLFVGKEGLLTAAVAVIGLFSFALSVAGTLAGVFVGKKFKLPALLSGGIILILIGIKIWAEGVFSGLF